MAKTSFLKLATTLSLLLTLSLLSQIEAFSSPNFEEDDEEVYVLDNPVSPHVRSGSRFLASTIIKKGTHCNRTTYHICNGVWANKGKSLLYCCKTHCRNILGDGNNCGTCGNKCKYGHRCCNGVCTDVLYNVNHCGKCKKKCSNGVPCENGFCGYA